MSLELDLGVQVLTTGSWPQATTSAPCNLPRELEQCTEQFKQYYLATYSGGCWAVGRAGAGGAAQEGGGCQRRRRHSKVAPLRRWGRSQGWGVGWQRSGPGQRQCS